MVTMAGDVLELKIRKVLIDIVLFNIVGWPNFLLGKFGTPYKRGIFCDDDTIKYPIKEGTVTFGWLVIIGFGVNALGMFITEYYRRDDKKGVCRGVKFPLWIYKFYCAYGMFCFGDLILWGITDSIKYITGRLRPHFYYSCLPEICFVRFNSHEYYENFTCKNSEPKELRLSFPSGHTSFFMYTMVYFAIYLQCRMTWKGSKLMKHVLQYVVILSAYMVGMTRVSDYKHHWNDVLAGICLGTIVAIVVARCMSDLFVRKPKKKNDYPGDLKKSDYPGDLKNTGCCLILDNGSCAVCK